VSRAPQVREFTVECNPGQTDARVLSMLRRCGVNRLSFGVQSFLPEELRFLGRCHTVQEAVNSIRTAYDLGFDNVGIDLIFAIPGSTLASWRRSLEAAAALGVQHISAYALSIEQGTALHTAVLAGELEPIDEDLDRAMYDLAIDYLTSAGFAQYEISNFAREGFACLHNQGYWENRSYLGIGPSAASYWHSGRTMNISNIREYVVRIEAGQAVVDQSECVDSTDRVCETAVLNLRTRKGVDLAAFRAATGADFTEVFAVPVERYRRQSLIEVDAAGVRLARQALPIADSILCEFSSF
jgi:oxygen-independent coproporphyrinogen-3 oxidase